MGTDRRRVRGLLLAVFVPVLIVLALLATAVLGHGAPARRTATAPAPPALPAPSPAQAAAPAPPAPAPSPSPSPSPAPSAAPARPATPAPEVQPQPEPGTEPEFAPAPTTRYVPAGAERTDLGEGARAVSIFRPLGSSGAPGPVVIFLHGWVAIDPARYGPWIGHLVSRGDTVIFPAYQTKPAYDTTTPLGNVLAGVRAALSEVVVAPGRLVVAGHSAGGALAADYAAVAADNGLPAPAAVFSVYPGRKLRYLDVPIPSADLSKIAPGTRVLVLAGQRDTAVGSGTAHRIAEGATRARVTLDTVTDDAVDRHSAPRTFDGAAQRTFWAPLDALVAATRPASDDSPTP